MDKKQLKKSISLVNLENIIVSQSLPAIHLNSDTIEEEDDKPHERLTNSSTTVEASEITPLNQHSEDSRNTEPAPLHLTEGIQGIILLKNRGKYHLPGSKRNHAMELLDKLKTQLPPSSTVSKHDDGSSLKQQMDQLNNSIQKFK